MTTQPRLWLIDTTLVQILPPDDTIEVQYIRRSTLADGEATVLDRAQLDALVRQRSRLQRHFAAVYERRDDPSFAMDVEFEIDVAGVVVIEQAWPWVD
ncbi:MAG: hypothetical protein K0V04_43140 [Deltaproteobacteria bacterium]|nr:hypothetical protein [Deltaproteobacteria bacterium]